MKLPTVRLQGIPNFDHPLFRYSDPSGMMPSTLVLAAGLGIQAPLFGEFEQVLFVMLGHLASIRSMKIPDQADRPFGHSSRFWSIERFEFIDKRRFFMYSKAAGIEPR